MAPEKRVPTTRRRDTHYATVEAYPPDGGDVHVLRLNSICDCAWNASHGCGRSAADEWGRAIVTTWLRDEHMPKTFTEYVKMKNGTIYSYELQEADLPY